MNKKIIPTDKCLKYLYFVEDYSLRDIERLFKISRETIRKKLANTKKKLLQNKQ